MHVDWQCKLTHHLQYNQQTTSDYWLLTTSYSGWLFVLWGLTTLIRHYMHFDTFLFRDTNILIHYYDFIDITHHHYHITAYTICTTCTTDTTCTFPVLTLWAADWYRWLLRPSYMAIMLWLTICEDRVLAGIDVWGNCRGRIGVDNNC